MNENLIGVIAGSGMLPVFWLEKASALNCKSIVISVTGQGCDEQLKNASDNFFNIRAGNLGEIFAILKKFGVKRAVLLGNVTWTDLLSEEGPDCRLQNMLRGLKGRDALDFFNSLAQEFQNENIELLDQTVFMEECLAGEGNLTPEIEFRDSLKADMIKAFEMVIALSGLGIGQAVVVKDGVVAAVEAIEGTNSTIIRSGSLVEGGVVAKASAENQDFRFDVPIVGIETIQSMITAKSAALIVEAGRTIMLNKDNMLKLAAENRILVFGRKRDA